MKKIAFLSNYPPHYRLPIYRAMSENFNIDFYFGNLASSSSLVKIKDFKQNELKNYKRQFKTINVFRGYTWYKGCHILLKKEYEEYIVIGELSSFSVWLILLNARIFHKPIGLWMHGIKSKQISIKLRVLFRLFIKLSSKQYIYGNYAIENMKSLGFNVSKMLPIHNSLNTEYQTKVYEKLSANNVYKNYFKNNYPVIIFSGRIQKNKNIPFLIECLGSLKSKNILCNLILIGEIDSDLNIQELIKKVGLNKNIWLYGPLYDEEKTGNFFYNASVCVSPGSIGLTAIHSMTYGTPAVSHNDFSIQMPEFESIQPGRTGDFFEKNNMEDLCDKVKYWISVKNREEIRKNCRNEVLKNWSINYQIKIFKE